jgi:hypothetical protein
VYLMIHMWCTASFVVAQAYQLALCYAQPAHMPLLQSMTWHAPSHLARFCWATADVSKPLCYQLDARYSVTMIAMQCTNMSLNTAVRRLLHMHRKRIEIHNRQREQMGVTQRLTRHSAGISLMIAASFCVMRVSTHR